MRANSRAFQTVVRYNPPLVSVFSGSKRLVTTERELILSRLLRAQTLTVTFKKPWISLAETNIAASSAAMPSDHISKWWCLLDKARTFFEENQGADSVV